MHLSHEAYIEGRQAEAVRFAQSLLSGNAEFLVAIRHLSCLRNEIGTNSSDQDFSLFLVIDSETDHLPAGEVKSLCSPEWLQKANTEIEAIQALYRVELAAACNKIVGRFSVRV